jgi:hypothetical protein
MKNRILIRIALFCKALLLISVFYSCSEKSNVAPVYAEIPDANFKACLRKLVPLAFTADGKFISNHSSVVSYDEVMSLRRKNITSLSGIEHFTSLTSLDCFDNKISSVDLSKNKALTKIYCTHNQLTQLDLSKNTNLIELNCSNNQLTILDVSKNHNLIDLICYNNLITNIKLGDNEVLRQIYCPGNRLDFLDVRRNKGLIELNCKANLRNTVIIVDPNSKLARLYLDSFIMCNHPSIKAFKDRGGELYGTFSEVLPPFDCK